jgi:hypothetical protein
VAEAVVGVGVEVLPEEGVKTVVEVLPEEGVEGVTKTQVDRLLT